jgi:hypothetical protein
MSLITRTIMEAEAASGREAVWTALREWARRGLLRARANQPAGVGVAGPVVAGPARAGSSKQARGGASPTGVGTPIGNNSPGQPVVQAIGRARVAKPIRSVKSRVVPEPDQLQSGPPTRREIPEH